MPNLSCSVKSCSHNDERLCCLNSINVAGNSSKEDTCCSSFTDSFKNSNSSPMPQTKIDCKATDCAYNERCACTANNVDICSCGEACNCQDTECSTFMKNY